MYEAAPPVGDTAGRRVGEVLGRSAVACPPGTSVRQAAELMAEADTGSIVVLGQDGQPRGILTDSDLRRRVVAAGRSAGTPVEAIMSSPVLTVPASTTFFEAIGLMLERHIHHLVVAERDRPLGVIADSDLVAALTVGPLFLARRISRARSIQELAEARAVLPRMARVLLSAGVGIYDLARITAETTDRVVRRALHLIEVELGAPPVPYCWLGLGSEGRREQTLHTDQDHALVYADPPGGEVDATREYFQLLGRRATEVLELCGIPLCKGEVMASNPRWNRPLSSWLEHFGEWIERPQPEALLNAAIFFDLRPVAGQVELGARVQDEVARLAPHGGVFLMLLADQAHANRPPLGFFRHFVVERGGEHRGELNIKLGGLMPIVDLARVYALKHGVRQTNTVERLRALMEAGVIPKETGADLISGYEFLLLLRVKTHLAQAAEGRPMDNYVEPRKLPRAERTLLKDYFAVVASAQDELRREFSSYLLG